MKRMFLGAATVLLLLMPSLMRAQATQTIRGQVCDVASGEPMVGVTITVENGITMGGVSDIDGNFVIENVPVGRHSIRATFIGFDAVADVCCQAYLCLNPYVGCTCLLHHLLK